MGPQLALRERPLRKIAGPQRGHSSERLRCRPAPGSLVQVGHEPETKNLSPRMGIKLQEVSAGVLVYTADWLMAQPFLLLHPEENCEF